MIVDCTSHLLHLSRCSTSDIFHYDFDRCFLWKDVFSSSDNNFGYSHSDDNNTNDDNDSYNNIL